MCKNSNYLVSTQDRVLSTDRLSCQGDFSKLWSYKQVLYGLDNDMVLFARFYGMLVYGKSWGMLGGKNQHLY